MRIKRVFPKPPPEFAMSFSLNEGWAIVAALTAYAEHHKQAVDRENWKRLAAELDKELRRDV